jgi:hypothetical protein
MHEFVRKVQDFRKVPLRVLDQEMQQSRLVLAVFGADQLKKKKSLTSGANPRAHYPELFRRTEGRTVGIPRSSLGANFTPALGIKCCH